MKHRVFTIPNILSMVRIAMIPVIIALIIRRAMTAAAIMIILSGVTDLLDGYIARHFNMITDLGKMLDPFADKCTQGVVAICLCVLYPSLFPMLMLLIVKEITMFFCGLLVLQKKHKPFAARWWGKISTGVFYVVSVIICMWSNVLSLKWIHILSGTASLLLLFSLIMYIRMYIEILHSPDPSPQQGDESAEKATIDDGSADLLAVVKPAQTEENSK